jgi:hypothetical protein
MEHRIVDGNSSPVSLPATKHELLTISPNCLTCGKIICVQEGPGPCTFCGTSVLSKEQQLELIAEAKRKRAETAREKNRQLHKKSVAPGASHGMSRYASKLSGAVISDRSDEWLGPAEWEEQQRQAERARLDAERHKEKLLEFQRSSAKRTTVIGKSTKKKFHPCLIILNHKQIKLQTTNCRQMVVTFG